MVKIKYTSHNSDEQIEAYFLKNEYHHGSIVAIQIIHNNRNVNTCSLKS